MDIEEKAKKIEAIYNEHIEKIKKLRRQQNQVIDEFVKKLEEAKLEEVRNSLKK